MNDRTKLQREDDDTRQPSDALVLFGITGDLAFEKIIPALQAMVQRKTLHVSVVGVARSGWSRDKLLDRMHASLTAHDAFDASAFKTLSALFEYVDGDYTDPATFVRLRDALGRASRPAALPGDPTVAVRAGDPTSGGRRLHRSRPSHDREALRPRPAPPRGS